PERALDERLAFPPGQIGRRGELFDGHVPAERLVAGAPHGAHAAPADRRQQTIASCDQGTGVSGVTIFANWARFRHTERTTLSFSSHAESRRVGASAPIPCAGRYPFFFAGVKVAAKPWKYGRSFFQESALVCQ